MGDRLFLVELPLRKVRETFKPPEYPQTAKQYGDSLANWVVYQNVALGQNILKIKRCLREVFKLDVPQPTSTASRHRWQDATNDKYCDYY